MLAYRRAARGGRRRALPVADRAAARRAPAAARRARSCSPPTTSCRASRAAASSPPSGASTSASTPSSCTPSTAARGSSSALGIAPAKVHVIAARRVRPPHARAGRARRCRAELAAVDKPVVLCFGLMRPYKGIDVLLDAWRAADPDAELWIVGMPRMDIAPLRAAAPPAVRWVPRFVTDAELAALLPPRRPRRPALPRDRPVRRAVHRAGVRRAAGAERRRRLPRGRRGRAPRRSSRPATRPRWRTSSRACSADPAARAAARRRRPRGRRRRVLVGRDRRARHLALYATLADRASDDWRVSLGDRLLALRRPARLRAGRLPAAARRARVALRPRPRRPRRSRASCRRSA